MFLAELPGLSITTYTIVEAEHKDENSASFASVYCRNCTSSKNLFEISSFEVSKKEPLLVIMLELNLNDFIQVGNIQLSNNKQQLLFDRNTGLLLGIKNLDD